MKRSLYLTNTNTYILKFVRHKEYSEQVIQIVEKTLVRKKGWLQRISTVVVTEWSKEYANLLPCEGMLN